MKRQVMTKWVDALRSGKYKQTKGTLKDKKGHCCLGVLCELYIKTKKINAQRAEELLEDVILPAEVRDWAGIDQRNGEFRNSKGQGRCLSQWNDRGKSFKHIAHLIEINYERI